jgi:hypothetical protein
LRTLAGRATRFDPDYHRLGTFQRHWLCCREVSVIEAAVDEPPAGAVRELGRNGGGFGGRPGSEEAPLGSDAARLVEH